ncbi:MAG TPA: hypothetical protein VK325_08850 [Pseudoxanthomonas sp.]|nr:hypothetical protein [Pseudoxanthomonas sp.]
MKEWVVATVFLLAAIAGAGAIALASGSLGAWTAPAVLAWLLVLSKALAVALAIGHSR